MKRNLDFDSFIMLVPLLIIIGLGASLILMIVDLIML